LAATAGECWPHLVCVFQAALPDRSPVISGSRIPPLMRVALEKMHPRSVPVTSGAQPVAQFSSLPDWANFLDANPSWKLRCFSSFPIEVVNQSVGSISLFASHIEDLRRIDPQTLSSWQSLAGMA